MALAESPIPVSGRSKSRTMLLRFLGRVVLAVCLASASLSFLQHHARHLGDERLLEDPLTVALRGSGVSVLESEIFVVAPVERGPAPSLSELKEIAAGVARAMPGYDAESYWTESNGTYRVVYFEGREPAGGKWIASARYIPGGAVAGVGAEGGLAGGRDDLGYSLGSAGRVANVGSAGGVESVGSVEVAVYRSFLGVPRQIGQLARGTKGLVERSVGRPLRGSEATVRLRGRPPSDLSRDEAAREILSRVGADLRYESDDAARYVAAGFSPRLVGRAQLGRQTVNVVVSLSQLGMGSWVEVESPAL